MLHETKEFKTASTVVALVIISAITTLIVVGVISIATILTGV